MLNSPVKNIHFFSFLTIFWSFYRSRHPFAKLLLKHGSPWRAVASSVNIEFRRITKFSSIIGGTSLYITDSWIIKCSAYKVDIAHQPDVHLSIIHAEDHDISHESSVAVQFLNIGVASITAGVKPFVIRLNSSDYGDLREKLQAPVRNARNVVIHQSLSDKFIEAFKEQVSQNESYQLLEGDEVCHRETLSSVPVTSNVFLCQGRSLHL